MLTAMLDLAMAFAALCTLEDGYIVPSLEVKTSFIALARAGEITGEGMPVRKAAPSHSWRAVSPTRRATCSPPRAPLHRSDCVRPSRNRGAGVTRLSRGCGATCCSAMRSAYCALRAAGYGLRTTD
jgi:hypothetical protein